MGKITIEKHGKTYRYRFEVAPIGGQRQIFRKSGFATKREAREAGEKAKYEYEHEGIIPSQKISEYTYADYLDYWMENEIENTFKIGTVNNYSKYIRLYIKPRIGKYLLKNLTNQILEKCLYDLYNEGFSKNTISSIRGIFTKSLRYAAKNKYLVYSPADGIELTFTNKKGIGRPPTKPTRSNPHIYIPKEQMDAIFQRFPEGSSSYIPLMIGYHCGLRIGEVFALTWDDIDFTNKTLTVNRQVQWKKDLNRTADDKKQSNGKTTAGEGYWYFAEPKYRSYRKIDIDPFLCEILQTEKERQDSARTEMQQTASYLSCFCEYPLTLTDGKPPENQPPDNRIYLTQLFGRQAENTMAQEFRKKKLHEINFVCRREDGSYITSRTMQHTSSVIQKQLGIQGFDFHSLRHTHGTMLVEAKAPLVYVKERLGHSKIEMTFHYTDHATEQFSKEGQDLLLALFQ